MKSRNFCVFFLENLRRTHPHSPLSSLTEKLHLDLPFMCSIGIEICVSDLELVEKPISICNNRTTMYSIMTCE